MEIWVNPSVPQASFYCILKMVGLIFIFVPSFPTGLVYHNGPPKNKGKYETLNFLCHFEKWKNFCQVFFVEFSLSENCLIGQVNFGLVSPCFEIFGKIVTKWVLQNHYSKRNS